MFRSSPKQLPWKQSEYWKNTQAWTNLFIFGIFFRIPSNLHGQGQVSSSDFASRQQADNNSRALLKSESEVDEDDDNDDEDPELEGFPRVEDQKAIRWTANESRKLQDFA